jgi:L-amino acid N-acyltransferase YncA
MMARMDIRLAGPGDAAGIQAIYGPVVAETATSFEYEVPDAAEMARRVAARWPAHPWLVAVDSDGGDGGEDGVLGYAYAGPFSGRTAYTWSTEVSVYVHPDAHRRGIGRSLYAALFALLRRQGYRRAYAGVTLPNPASVGLHEAVGFVPVGCYARVGWKFGAWHDVGWWQRSLDGEDRDAAPPGDIRPLDALSPGEIAAACRVGLP